MMSRGRLKILYDPQQYSRRNCIVIHGFLKSTMKLRTLTIRSQFGHNSVIAERHLNLKINREAIDRSHRLRSRSDSTGKPRCRPVMVKFVDYNTRSSFYRLRPKFKGANMFLHESLTQECLRWLNTARHHQSVETVWTQNGRIEIRKKDGTRVVVGCADDPGKLR